MKDRKTPSGYIESLCSKGELKDLTIKDILSDAKSAGYVFEYSSIRRALLRSKFIVKTKKNNIVRYSQRYPPTSNSITSVDEERYILVFKRLQLHEDIKKASSKLFLDQHYDQAVHNAFKKIDNLVKNKSKQSKSGKSLMMSTFSPEKPILKINNFVTQSEKDEQEGFMYIFAGAMQGIRNPYSHENEIDKNPWNAIELLCLASLLAKKIEKTKLNITNSKKKKLIK